MLMWPRFLLSTWLLLFGTVLAQLNVVTTIGMLADVAGNVGGEHVSVTALMGPGVDPHLYRASAQDVPTLQNADLILYSGYSLEGQLGDVLERFSRQKPTVAVAERSVAADLILTADNQYGVDPHVWMDVGLWSRTVDTIRDVLSEHDPENASAFNANADTYREQLLALDSWISEAISSIPTEQRVIVTAHDAFSYFGFAYGIDVFGIQGISTDTEAAVADIRDTVSLIVERNVPALFVESTINPRTVQSVREAVERRGHSVRIGGELYSDAMGPAGTPDGTYIGMLRHNASAITKALGGTLPALPDALRVWENTWSDH